MAEEERKVVFIAPPSMVNKVTCIKAIRMLTGLGLKEAKDAAERPGYIQTFPLALSNFSTYGNPEHEIENLIRTLRIEGFDIGHPIQKLLEELREIGAQALRQGEDEFANEILQLVLAEKLRRGTKLY